MTEQTSAEGRDSTYRNFATKGPAAQISDGDTDLCLFLSDWRSGFAVTEERCAGTRRSLQFFDATDRPVQKIFLREDSSLELYDRSGEMVVYLARL